NLSIGPEPWEYIDDVDSAIDRYRMEMAIDPVIMGIIEGQNFTIHASIEDWNKDYDVSDGQIDLTAINVEDGTRAPKPKVGISKTGPATAAPGDTITYTITITNSRPLDAYDVAVTEFYPAGVTFVSATPAPTSGDNVWDIGTLSGNTALTISITVLVDSTLLNGDILTNTAEVYYTDGSNWWRSWDDSVDTTIVVPIPEMQNLAMPIGGILLVIIIFRNRKPSLKGKKEDE
ncbi:MAG: DUF11 domain-containing protein, partial [Thermoplasmata archaeon]|nr:DUF11 domain-containing protein [Thermoplasmata archaeon]